MARVPKAMTAIMRDPRLRWGDIHAHLQPGQLVIEALSGGLVEHARVVDDMLRAGRRQVQDVQLVGERRTADAAEGEHGRRSGLRACNCDGNVLLIILLLLMDAISVFTTAHVA